jgi:hypothetical protein
MLRAITLGSAAVAAIALATITGCSSSATGSGSVIAGSKSTAARSSSVAGSPAAAASSSSDASSGSLAPSGSSSSSSSGAASTSGVDVCSLLTAAQASALNNVTYSSATPGSEGGYFQTCTYKNAGSADPVDIQDLTVELATASGCWAQLESADGPGQPISGLGQAAFGYQIGIYVEAGSRCLGISGLTHAELLNNYGPDTAMAKLILAKLG